MAEKILLKNASLLNEQAQCIRHQDVLIHAGIIEKISDNGKWMPWNLQKLLTVPGTM